jgi:hypothetical protein
MFLGSRARPVRRADNLTTIREPTVYTIWDPQHLTTLLASTACQGDSLTFFFLDGLKGKKFLIQIVDYLLN